MAAHQIYLSLGSNLGDRPANLRSALPALERAGVRILRSSALYETEPVDFLDQPWFLNCVLHAETNLPALELLRALRGIEASLGSHKLIPKGPRLLDLDILLYGQETISTPDLQVPHPSMLLRRFVLIPLAELAPALRHPSWDAPAAELLARCPDRSSVRLFSSPVPSDN
jgi:2-amino-4-hydroxy-6-hydroxymethyldihydropteridine diphosphokinase